MQEVEPQVSGIPVPDLAREHLWKLPQPMLRTWLLLVDMLLSTGSPVAVSAAKINGITAESGRPVSRRSATQSLKGLIKEGVLKGHRDGNVWIIRLPLSKNV